MVAVLLGVFWGGLAQGVDPAIQEEAAAPTLEDISRQLDDRLQQVTRVRDLLATFVRGELIDVPVEALFILDLADEDAVQLRVSDLKRLQRDPDRGSAEKAALLAQSAASDPGVAMKVEELSALDREISGLRLKFLSLPRDRREALLRAQRTGREQSELGKTLAVERTSGQTQRDEAAVALDAAQRLAQLSPDPNIRELASRQMLVESVQLELADLKIRWSAGYEDRNRFYQEIAGRLSVLAAGPGSSETQEPTSNGYIEASRIWRTLVSRTFAQAAEFTRMPRIPDLPAYPEQLLKRLEGIPQASSYRLAYQDLIKNREALSGLRIQYMNALRESLYRLLLQSADLRSSFVRAAVRQGDYPILRQPAEYFSDLLRELRIVPYMWVATASMGLFSLQEKITLGVKGILDLVAGFLLFIAVAAVPFLFRSLAAPVHRVLAWSQDALMSARYRLLLADRLAVALQLLRPYVSWIVALCGIWTAGRLAEGAGLKGLLHLLPYANYYVGYRMFRIFLTSTFTVRAFSGDAHAQALESDKVRRTVRRLGISFFLALAFLHAVEIAVGKALVYRLIRTALILGAACVAAVAVRQRRDKIKGRAEQVLPRSLGLRIARLCSGRLSVVWSLLTLVLLVLVSVAARLAAFSVRFDLFKRVQAELFRRRLETGGKELKEAARDHDLDGRVPEEYLRWFDLYLPPEESSCITGKSRILRAVAVLVRDWAEGRTDERSLALYGEKGIGKSTLLGRLGRELTDLQVLSLSLPPKLCSREQVLRFFEEKLGTDLANGGRDILRGDAERPKTVILLDDAHNLFLAQLGGFEGYRTFQELTGTRTRNLFWCAAFNRHPWIYLQGALGQDLGFRSSFAVPPWSDEEIRDLIMSRHRRTSYRLSYESVIRATQGQGDAEIPESIEVQFSRLLWGQSRGNPRTAMALWVSSLTPLGGHALRVRVPKPFQARDLESASDDLMFVYASVVIHENLTTEEAIAATNLPEATVRHAISIGMEKSVLSAGQDRRYRVTPVAQPVLTRILATRNFLYE
ncbi:MAG: ATP-binding protein [bacterium]